jgi:hypothetical protein
LTSINDKVGSVISALKHEIGRLNPRGQRAVR